MKESSYKLELIDKGKQQNNSSEALKKLIAIFEDKKKINKEIEWKTFFLSEDFLKEQYSEKFADGMFQYLSCLHTEENYTIHSLPSRFLLELAVAYAFMPEKRQSAFVNVEESFYARKKAAQIWNMQKGEYAYPIRILWKPENLVRLFSFSDYIELKNKNKEHNLTLENSKDWKRLIRNGSISNIYERNGRGSAIIYEETRSECLITLYTFLIQTEQMPKCILESMYQEYCLKDMEHSSSKNLYAQLKKEILMQYPDIETVLYDPNSKTQMISRWYREFIKIISDHHRNYDIGIYEDTEIIKKQIQSLFEREEWKKFQYDSELFEKMFSQLSNRKVLPKTLANYLISFYSQDKLCDKDKVKQILEDLYQSLGFNRNIKEMDSTEIINYEKTEIEDIYNENLDFWQYYFQWGFGFRNAALEVSGQKDKIYQKNNCCYLPAYIKDIYYPSPSWQKIFTSFDEKENTILHPNSIEITLIDGNQLKVEFHLHYVLYFLNGEQVLYPFYTFYECMELAKSLEKTEDKFFLLAITRIEKKERLEAVKVIETWLQKLPLYPLTIPVIARLLAEDNDRDWEREQIRAIYYMEQERFCFRVIVYLEQIVIYHQQDFGWKAIKAIYKKEEQGEEIEKQKQLALEILHDLKQPKPILIEAVSLEHMEKEEKAEKIVEAWKNYDKYYMEKEGKTQYSFFAFLGQEGEIGKPTKELFEKNGQFLTESYCVLSYGSQGKYKRVFYCAINPFGFDSMCYNEYEYGLRELKRKIKEKNKVIGRFGWGEVYTKKERFLPVYFALGESGTYYAFDGIHMIKTENFAALLAKLFDFTKVSLVEIYQGHLSISRFDDRLEYCYDREDFLESIYQIEKTKADFFTRFTKTEIVKELAMQLDTIFYEMTCDIPVLYFQFQKAKGGTYILDIFGQFALVYHNKKEQQKYRKGLLGEKKKIVWKLWNHNITRNTMLREFESFISWYREHGIYGEKLSHCLEIIVGLIGFCGNVKTEQILYKNKDGILKAIKERTKMTAYSLTMNKKRKPELFDSKFGGLAYWDIKKEYPSDSNGKKLMLIAQINLDQDPMEALSLQHGMLQFFGSGEEIFCRGFGVKEDQDKFRVVYHSQIDYTITKEKLRLLGLPDSTDKDKGYIHMPISKELAFDVEKQEVFMGTGDYRFKKELKAAIKQMFSIKIMGSPYFILEKNKIEDEIDNAGNWILGYPDFVRKDPRKYKKYKETLKQYDRQLFQFDVHYLDDNDYYFEHGGCGIAHFFIRSEDLKQKDFSHVMYHWKSC